VRRRRAGRAATLLGALLGWVLIAPAPAPAQTIVTYNIHAGKDADGKANLVRVAAALDTVGADVVLLQEVDRGTRRSGGEDQLATLERLTGLHGAFARSLDFQGGAYGIAVLSRWPIARAETLPLPAEPPQERAGGAYEPRVALFAELTTPAGTLHVVNTHLGAGSGTYRRQELVALLAGIHRRIPAGAALVVGGDFNAAPESDVYGAVTLSLDDAWAACGDGPGYTYPAAEPDRRIDYLFLRAVACATAAVCPGAASDHRALVVELGPR